jgi:hypothetical protein
MPERPISVEKPKQLLVEGRDEEGFFGALLKHLDIDDIEVQNYGGKNNFRRFLNVFVISPEFDRVQSIGIVRDADDSAASAFQSVQGSLQFVNLPTPGEMLAPAGDPPRVSVFILPDNTKCGALEDLCLSALEDDPAISCVSEFMQCVRQSAEEVPGNEAKARVHAFLASREDPELRLGEAAQRGFLPWRNTAFAQLIGFLRCM